MFEPQENLKIVRPTTETNLIMHLQIVLVHASHGYVRSSWEQSAAHDSYITTSSLLYRCVANAFFASAVSLSTLKSFAEQSVTQVFTNIMLKDKNDPLFKNAKIDDINKLIQLGTYEIVPNTKVPPSISILSSRFILTIKNH